MSSTFQSQPTVSNKPSGLSSFLNSSWGRLLWKDAREIVPIWITLFLAAILCVMVTFWMVNRGNASITPLYINGHTFIALCSVITGVFLLANEDENRTLHLLRNLPLRPRQILWHKLLLGSVGVVLIACLIAAITMLMANITQGSSRISSSYHFTAANVILLPLLYLTISFLSAMHSRSLFYGVLIAGFVSFGVIWTLEPTWLGAIESPAIRERTGIRWLWVTLAIAGGVSALVLNAGHWVEEKVSEQKATRDKLLSTSLLRPFAATNTPSGASLANTFSALLWQSYRQTRKSLLCCIALVLAGWLLIPVGLASEIFDSKLNADEYPIVVSFMSLFWMLAMTIAFSSTTFLDDKRTNNFLFFQQNRERSRWFWLSRLLPFWAVALTLVLTWKFFIFDPAINSAADSGIWGVMTNDIPRINELGIYTAVQIVSQSLLIPLLSMLAIIGIGQYFSMFVRNPILSFVFTGIVSIVFLAVTTYVIFVNESAWWTLVPIVAAIYVATWWRSKSWLATSPKAFSFFLPLAVPMIALAMIVAIFINHRATEYDDLAVSPTEYAKWSHGGEWAHGAFKFGTEAQADEAADLYRDAVNLFKGEYDPGLNNDPKRWSEKQTAAYVDKNKNAIEKVIDAAKLPICAPFLVADTDARARQKFLLCEMSLANALHEVNNGDLSNAKQAIDAYDRVWQRTNDGLAYNRYWSGYYGLLVKWADHPAQTVAAIKSAIAQLEGPPSDSQPNVNIAQTDQENAKAISPAALYREFGGEQFFMDLQHELDALKEDADRSSTYAVKQMFWLMPWEYQRLRKVAQRRAVHLFQMQQRSLEFMPAQNDRSVPKNRLIKILNSIGYRPYIPIAEDRFDVGNFYQSWGIGQNTVEQFNWRRYVLLRLGLAAYKIEHDEYPEDLAALDAYYQRGLPVLSTGQAFGWYKDGLEYDLVSGISGDEESGNVIYGRKLAENQSPVLLPFAIDSTKSLPKPVEYEKGKLGIDLSRIHNQRVHYQCGINNYSKYHIELSVGVTKED